MRAGPRARHGIARDPRDDSLRDLSSTWTVPAVRQFAQTNDFGPARAKRSPAQPSSIPALTAGALWARFLRAAAVSSAPLQGIGAVHAQSLQSTPLGAIVSIT